GQLLWRNASGAPLPNANGIQLSTVFGNTIGGTTAGAGNVIANNTGFGVTLIAGGSSNAVLSNSIYSNGNSEITRQTGTNNNQPAPVLTSVSSAGGFTVIQGTATGPANTTGTV